MKTKLCARMLACMCGAECVAVLRHSVSVFFVLYRHKYLSRKGPIEYERQQSVCGFFVLCLLLWVNTHGLIKYAFRSNGNKSHGYGKPRFTQMFLVIHVMCVCVCVRDIPHTHTSVISKPENVCHRLDDFRKYTPNVVRKHLYNMNMMWYV